MVAKNDLKLIRSLRQKKYRARHGLFLAEGVKLVSELLEMGIKPFALYTTGEDDLPGASRISESDLRKVSTLVQPNKWLGLFPIPEAQNPVFDDWTLALDGVRDPGNLGTIIRLCDWFGIGQLVCSPDTVDCYNPKVLQATMGSIARVRISYTDLGKARELSGLPWYGASMEGETIGRSVPVGPAVLVMGSESHGLSEPVRDSLDQMLAIPAFGGAESLNVATATAILLYEVRRGAISG